MASCARAFSKAPLTLLPVSRNVSRSAVSARAVRDLQSGQRSQQVRHKSYAIPTAGREHFHMIISGIYIDFFQAIHRSPANIQALFGSVMPAAARYA